MLVEKSSFGKVKLKTGPIVVSGSIKENSYSIKYKLTEEKSENTRNSNTSI